MKIIDLINKIAKGEKVPKRIRIEHWCYKFEWVEHLENYYDEDSDIDLMSALTMNKEELNYEVKIIEEDKKIEKIDKRVLSQNLMISNSNAPIDEKWKLVQKLIYDNSIEIEKVKNKLNELIDEVNKLKEK